MSPDFRDHLKRKGYKVDHLKSKGVSSNQHFSGVMLNFRRCIWSIIVIGCTWCISWYRIKCVTTRLLAVPNKTPPRKILTLRKLRVGSSDMICMEHLLRSSHWHADISHQVYAFGACQDDEAGLLSMGDGNPWKCWLIAGRNLKTIIISMFIFCSKSCESWFIIIIIISINCNFAFNIQQNNKVSTWRYSSGPLNFVSGPNPGISVKPFWGKIADPGPLTLTAFLGRDFRETHGMRVGFSRGEEMLGKNWHNIV